jgi:hypothetical protein
MNTEDAGAVDYKPVDVHYTAGYTSTYEAIHLLSKVVSFIRWAVVGLGIITLLIAIDGAQSRYGFK